MLTMKGKCVYCSNETPIKCTTCASFFCNTKGNASVSHILFHLAKHHHKSVMFGDVCIECCLCKRGVVFDLGYEDDSENINENISLNCDVEGDGVSFANLDSVKSGKYNLYDDEIDSCVDENSCNINRNDLQSFTSYKNNSIPDTSYKKHLSNLNSSNSNSNSNSNNNNNNLGNLGNNDNLGTLNITNNNSIYNNSISNTNLNNNIYSISNNNIYSSNNNNIYSISYNNNNNNLNNNI
ncbi:hypothetical protein EDEG_01255, partial [Edhazardia aedis USNM 41457]